MSGADGSGGGLRDPATRPPRSLTEAELHHFGDDGFLSVSDIASADEVAQIRSIAERLLSKRVGFAEGTQFDAFDFEDEQPRFIQILGPHNYVADLRRMAFMQCAHRIAQQILGRKARLQSTMFLIKPASIGANTPWHQDEAFHDPHFESHSLTVWLPLQPVDGRNGCMEFIPGSHRKGVLPHAAIVAATPTHLIECVGDFNPSDAVACRLGVGSATIHGSRTLHCTGPNHSEAPRYVFAALFDITPTPAATPRIFDWQTLDSTARFKRRRIWRRRGGFLIEFFRMLRRLDFRDPERILYYGRRLLRSVMRR